MPSNLDLYLSYMAGNHDIDLPTPETKLEEYFVAIIAAIEQGGGLTYELPPATISALGGVKSNGSGGAFTVDSEGNVSINVSQYILPAASSSTLGGVKSDSSGGMFTVDANGVVTIDGYTKAQSDALIAAITALFPNQVSSQNKLTTEDYVNSSISTNTANFCGTFASEAALNAYSGTKTNNDYAFVVVYDETEPTQVKQYDRYKYNGSAWLFEYTLNNSSFTAAMWAAINSGITKALADSIVEKYVKPSGGIPASDLAQAVQDALAAGSSAYQKPTNGIPTSDMESSAQTVLGSGITAALVSGLNGLLAAPTQSVLATPYTVVGQNYCRKWSNVVTFSLAITIDTAAAYSVIATLPEGYRPSAPVYSVASKSGTTPPIAIASDGKIQLMEIAITTTATVRLGCTFVI